MIVQDLPNETLVYDPETHKAHCLNKTAAAIWRKCDGSTPVQFIAKQIRDEFELPADDGIIWMALQQLERAKLLEGPLAAPQEFARNSRRAALKRIGLVGGVAALLPLVTSVVAPTPAAASTALGPGSPCSDPLQCQSMSCNNTTGKCA